MANPSLMPARKMTPIVEVITVERRRRRWRREGKALFLAESFEERANISSCAAQWRFRAGCLRCGDAKLRRRWRAKRRTRIRVEPGVEPPRCRPCWRRFGASGDCATL